MDTIHRTSVDTGGIFYSNARLGNHVRHKATSSISRYAFGNTDSTTGQARYTADAMKAKIEKVSAITLTVADMEASLRFYRDVLGLELLDGGPNAGFSSLRITGTEFPIINLQQGRTAV